MPERASDPTEIVDRYISGTRLRLRRAEQAGAVLFKLGQKVRVDEQSPEVVKITNIYLDQEEYDVLRLLPAAELRKTRMQVAEGDRTFAVDVFHGPLAGVILAETELASTEPRLARPAFAAVDVTDDDGYAGGTLAVAGPPRLAGDERRSAREP